MLDGKKSVSEKIVYGAFDIVSKKTDKEPLEFFHEALANVKPNLEVKSRRVGGATYQVPMEVRPRRAQTLAMKWIVDCAVKRNEKTMRERLASEIIDAHNNKGNAVKKREETHKMAEANRAFSHFRW
jgi:small subunit ribosomal protein S7